ncbi:MAG: ABC transporter permease [Clostridia bacterium]
MDQKICRADAPYEKAVDASAGCENISRASVTYWQDVWCRFRSDKLALIGMGVIVVIALCAIFLPMVLPYTYDGMDLTSMNAGPSLRHPCGTDALGRDLFVRILYGARISLTIGVVAAAINFFIGVLYGGIAGFVGGRVDMVLMRIVDVLIGLPQLLYVVLIMLVLGSNIGSVIIALCFTSWIGTARVVRGEVMRLKHAEYVLAAKLAGASGWDVLISHLLPNCMGPIIVSTAFLIPSAIFSEACLSVVGIGIQAPQARGGPLANDAIPQMIIAPHQMFFPVLAICVTMFSLNFIGDGLRDALDPRLKK